MTTPISKLRGGLQLHIQMDSLDMAFVGGDHDAVDGLPLEAWDAGGHLPVTVIGWSQEHFQTWALSAVRVKRYSAPRLSRS